MLCYYTEVYGTWSDPSPSEVRAKEGKRSSVTAMGESKQGDEAAKGQGEVEA